MAKPFKVILVSPDRDLFEEAEEAFLEALDAIAQDVEEGQQSPLAKAFVVSVTKTKKARHLFKKIEKAYAGSGELKRKISTNNFLLVTVSSGGEDFAIEDIQ